MDETSADLESDFEPGLERWGDGDFGVGDGDDDTAWKVSA